MSLADELKKLEELRWNGTLTEAEFAQAKAALLAKLAEPPVDTVSEDQAKLSAQLAEVQYQNELERLDREWELEREKYYVIGKHGHRYIPTVGQSIGGAVVIGVFGVFWTVMAVSITSGAPDFGPFAIAKIFFPLFGIVFTSVGVYLGITASKKARDYEAALAAYHRRRAALTREDFR